MKSVTLKTAAPPEAPCPGTTSYDSQSSVLSDCHPDQAPACPPSRDTTMLLRIQQLRFEADEVISMLLGDPSGGTVPSWTPGAHLELVLPSGLLRQYSLCGDPDDRSGYRIAVLRQADGRGGSVEIHDTLHVGSEIEARVPRNHFELVDAEDYVLIGGGIGITPILPMVRQLKERRRPWRLFYGGRSRRSMAFLSELQELAGHGTVEITPQDELGLLNLDRIFAQVKNESLIYCCGPEQLLTAVQDKSIQLGMADRLHLERFSASAAQAALVDSAALGDGFDVELARTRATVRVEPGTTVLNALRSVVPDLPSECEAGICGTCEVRVLGGVPEHHDLILSDPERLAGNCMLICVSRSRTPRLLLDL